MPFVRLTVALSAGILLQWYASLQLATCLIFLVCSIVPALLNAILNRGSYSLRWLHGVCILLVITATGASLAYFANARNKSDWLGKHYTTGQPLLVTIQEPLVTKPNSYKAVARVNAVWKNNHWLPVTGSVLLYFKKDSNAAALGYGSAFIIQKPLQPVTNSGNPGGFDYARYCLFQGIGYQAYLTGKDYLPVKGYYGNWFKRFLFTLRSNVIGILRQYIPGKKEQAVAEALLIGYRDDLDRELVQAYSNTGVVHIIAISGLHLGMIYGLLKMLLARFSRKRWQRLLRPIIILLVLWMFTLLAGAAPSILRSAVMFSFIVLARNLGRHTNMYNTLAASAFCLLVLNPFMLWDVGFQLSYTAVLSIVLFSRPLYNLLYVKNKALDKLWQLNAMTFGAQILTLPVVLYHFHQFPLLFFITNLLMVPLSGLVLYAELVLLLAAILPVAAKFTGMVTGAGVWLMNTIVKHTDRLPFAVWDKLQVSMVQVLLLFTVIAAFAVWLMLKAKKALSLALLLLAAFLGLRAYDFFMKQRQEKLVVYNVPRYTAVDIIQGRNGSFLGDSVLLKDGFLQNFHLKPSRILHRITVEKTWPPQPAIIKAGSKSVLLINAPLAADSAGDKIKVDVVVLAGNPRLYISHLAAAVEFEQLVFDSSNPLWKIEKWKKDCQNLHLRFHSVPQQGAFVMNLR